MKKKLLVLLPLAGMILSGCEMPEFMNNIKFPAFMVKMFNLTEKQPEGKFMFKPYITGGTLEEKEAILNVMNSKPICNKSGNAVTEILPDVDAPLSEDEGDDVLLTTRQIASNNKFVDITWEADNQQLYFSKISKLDDVHDLLEVNYQHYGAPAGTLEWKIAKLQCGKAHVEYPKDMEYSATLTNEEYKHDDVKIREINRCTDEEISVDVKGTIYRFASTYDNVDYSYHPEYATYRPTFRTNNPDAEKNRYLYYNVPGKVIYTAPDGNWGLLGDGDQVLEFYIGAGKALTETNWPNLAKKYVLMSGNMGEYCGNIQMGFMTKIKELYDKSVIEEPLLTYPALTETDIASWDLSDRGYTSQKQAIDGFSGSLHSVTGTFIQGSIKDKSGSEVKAEKIDTMANNRFTFKLQVGQREMTVAYDYHTDREGEVGLFAALKNAMKTGGQMTVKGTMRYSGDDDKLFITEGNEGVWNIVPFLPEHVALAK